MQYYLSRLRIISLGLVVTVLLNNCVARYNAQFITHFDGKIFKGNITFEAREEAGESSLVIESIIESKQEIKFAKDEKNNFDESHQILLDWSLNSNSLMPSMLSSCSNDELGPSVSETLSKSLSQERPIVLNQLSRWVVSMKEFLQINKASSLAELIWDKSIKLKLSDIYNPPSEPSPVPTTLRKTSINGTSALSPQAGGSSKPPKGALGKPTLNGPVRQPSSKPPSKPTFAPRPKPNISGKLKTTTNAPALPKAQSLVLETTQVPHLVSSNSLPSASTTIIPIASTSTTSTTTAKPTSQAPINDTETRAKQIELIQKTTNRVLFKNYGRFIVCGNIVDNRNVKSVEAVFESQISGRITLRGNEDGVTRIVTNLYHIKSKVTTRYEWKILSSDILDDRRHEDECKYLQVLFDPDNVNDSDCRQGQDTRRCKMGDLTKKHGQIQVAGIGRSSRQNLIDLNLPVSALEGGSRSLFIALYEGSSRQIFSCAKIKPLDSRKLEATFNMDEVRGQVKLTQRYPTEPTSISYDLFGLEGNVKHLIIRELPVAARTSSDNNKLCGTLGDVYEIIPNSLLGNLTGRHGFLSVVDSEYEDHYSDDIIDLNLQLFGPETVAGRSMAIHKNNGEVWVCATINHMEQELNMAVAKFFYPVVGQISFQQLSNDHNAETGVLVDIYNPNGDKLQSENHNWLIHLKPAMADFYNWSQRCESSGDIYDPIQVSTGLTNDQYGKLCNRATLANEPLRCRLGDLSLKAGFKLSLGISSLNKTRHYYSDPFLPLAKLNSIIGRSLVIYDDNAPTQRGNRLACSTIKKVHPLKASVKTWNSGPSIPSAIVGEIKFKQESSKSETKININLSGFNGNVENYAIHNVWTMDDKEFPCSNDSLYDIYDPFDNENSLKLPPSTHYGSSATLDRVRVGDMSRKHGTFEGLQSVQRSLVDSNAPLFAPNSIIGRSIVLRAAVNDFRWVCGNIELDYDKSSSRLIVAMASFDEPRSKIAGYVRFVQLEHNDGSLSDTYVQADLRIQSDGIHELETSESHNWAIFVNQVGEDAYITADDVRCIAAGFKWNPYLAQDNLESYPIVCNNHEQQACAMGDLGMRHGLLTLGPNNRRSFSDSNLPLTGNYSVMSRSLVIFDNKRTTVKLACANIFPDIHLKSNVVIKRTPSFTVARFVEQMRELLGAADWLLVPELKATKPVANGECVQMTIHFYGQRAHQMQIELNNLITMGTVRKSTRIGVDKISTHYKLCRAGQSELPSSIRSNANSPILSSCHAKLTLITYAILFQSWLMFWSQRYTYVFKL